MTIIEETNKRAGFNQTLNIGESIAILVIDFQIGFTNPTLSPLASECGTEIENTSTVLEEARKNGIPVFFCAIGYDHIDEAGVWGQKVSTLHHLKLGTPLVEIDERLHRKINEPVLIKKYASAFVGTSLASLLTAKKVDTLFVTGTSTSGCVRASVVDAIQSGISPFVIYNAVCDRSKEAHDNNLTDMKTKYAELISTKEALTILKNYRGKYL